MEYKEVAKQYQPTIIKTLLIGEAPPPDGKTYCIRCQKNIQFQNQKLKTILV